MASTTAGIMYSHIQGSTYYALAVLGEGRFDKHGAQGEAQVVFGVTHTELPAGKAGLKDTSQSDYPVLGFSNPGPFQWRPRFLSEQQRPFLTW